jgi:hypothetical protein
VPRAVGRRRRRTLLTLAALTVLAGALIASGVLAGASGAGISCWVHVRPTADPGRIAALLARAPDGSNVCLARGSYAGISVDGAVHREYVTLRSSPGQLATVDGIDVADSAHLRFEHLRLTEGINLHDTTGSSGSHDYQVLHDEFASPLYGVVLDGGSVPIRRVLIAGNRMDHVHLAQGEVGGRCNAGYAGGQDVTIYYAEGVTIAHNVFDQADWHYIQGGSAGPEGVNVSHNLFEGHISLPCSHLNVWQIWSGGVNDRFEGNVVRGDRSGPASVIPLIFENGSGGNECQVQMSNTTVSDNLFVNAASSYATMIFTTQGLTFTRNTVVGSEYGVWLDRSDFCGPSSGVTAEHNVSVKVLSHGSPARYVLGDCSGACSFEYNVSDDRSARQGGARHYVVHWSPRWSRWVRSASGPLGRAGNRWRPLGLPFPAGFAPSS